MPALRAPPTPSQPGPNPPASCPTCSGGAPGTPPRPAAPSYIYALGQFEARFQRQCAEREYAQVVGQIETKDLTEQQVFHKVFTNPQFRYLARQLFWVMNIAGQATYIVVPREPLHLDLLLGTLRPKKDLGALDALIGVRGGLAPADLANGLSLPMAFLEHAYSFDREALVKSLPNPAHVKKEEFAAMAHELVDRILSATDNTGNTPEHRALNYLTVRDPSIYKQTAECSERDVALTQMEGRLWPLGAATGTTNVEVLFTYTNRKNEYVEKYCVRVNVHELYPFITSKLAPYYDH
jgi:hypothetical protein